MVVVVADDVAIGAVAEVGIVCLDYIAQVGLGCLQVSLVDGQAVAYLGVGGCRLGVVLAGCCRHVLEVEAAVGQRAGLLQQTNGGCRHHQPAASSAQLLQRQVVFPGGIFLVAVEPFQQLLVEGVAHDGLQHRLFHRGELGCKAQEHQCRVADVHPQLHLVGIPHDGLLAAGV